MNKSINEEIKLDKNTKLMLKFADFIGWMLLLDAIFFAKSAFIWGVLIGDEKWFSRAAMASICLGFAGVIFRLRK